MAVAVENPLLEGLSMRRTPDPCAFVIFGASGDLTRRKLFPAVYSLALRRMLPENFAIVGVARTEESDDAFRDRMKHAVQEFGRDELDEKRGTAGNRVYYLAVPPNALSVLVQALGRRRSTNGWTRVVVEKPFGRDLESAKTLNAELLRDFDESEIFRIDHYLGKETVQNLLALRFANGI